jgi:hypothetical protein
VIEFCPHCGVSLQGPEIPPEDRKWFGGATHFNRRISIEIPDVYDGVLFYMCPLCSGRWHRWPEGHHYHNLAAPYVNGERDH